MGGSAAAKLAEGASSTGMRDKWWIVLFCLHLIFVFSIEGVYGSRFTAGTNIGAPSNTTKTVIGLLFTSAAAGTIFAAVWLKVLQWVEGKIVLTCTLANVVLSIVVAGYSFALGITGWGMYLIIWAIIVCIYVWLARSHIPFAEATLHAACKSLR